MSRRFEGTPTAGECDSFAILWGDVVINENGKDVVDVATLLPKVRTRRNGEPCRPEDAYPDPDACPDTYPETFPVAAPVACLVAS